MSCLHLSDALLPFRESLPCRSNNCIQSFDALQAAASAAFEVHTIMQLASPESQTLCRPPTGATLPRG